MKITDYISFFNTPVGIVGKSISVKDLYFDSESSQVCLINDGNYLYYGEECLLWIKNGEDSSGVIAILNMTHDKPSFSDVEFQLDGAFWVSEPLVRLSNYIRPLEEVKRLMNYTV